MDIKKIVKQLTLEEKAALVSGTDFWETNAIPRLNIPAIYMTDGPCGLRKQGENRDHLGLNESEKTTSFPTGSTFGASWNPNNMKKMGEAVAAECHAFNVNMILGPAINMKRNPKCGRNFEYISEDPLLSGDMGSIFVKTVQSKKIGVSVKHFAVNNNENNRFMDNAVVDERALRELYLRAFEKVIKESYPVTVMSAYNKVNGTYCSENKYLLMDILRKEWNFAGAVISDWGGVSNRIKSLQAGMDLEMPGDCEYFRAQVIAGIKSGELAKKDLDASVYRILTLIDKIWQPANQSAIFEQEKHHKISEDIAVDGAVLLKNENVLPLAHNEKLFVVGDLFRKMRYQGAGSSLINPTKLVTPENAFNERKIEYEFAQGYSETEIVANAKLEAEALQKAKNYEKVIFFGGQTDYVESEGYDRVEIKLPKNQVSLLEKLITLKKKIVFIMYGGSPVELPFVHQISGLLNMNLPGQAGGEATARLLFGETTPSGKLAETWVTNYKDIPFGSDYTKYREDLYKESIFVGYRYFDKRPTKEVLFPFGYGLSYTSFEYTKLQIKRIGDQINAQCTIQNTGKVAGGEVVQLYVSAPQSDVFKPKKELRAYKKVYLQPGESKNVEMIFSVASLAYYNKKIRNWVVENGNYVAHFSTSSVQEKGIVSFEINDQKKVSSPYKNDQLRHYFNSETLADVTEEEFSQLLGTEIPIETPLRPFTLDSKLDDLQATFIGKKFYSAVVGVGKKQYQKALKMEDGPEKNMNQKNGLFLMKMMPNNSLRSMAASSSGKFSFQMAYGLLDIFNGHYLSGIKKMMKKQKVPSLPKNKKE